MVFLLFSTAYCTAAIIIDAQKIPQNLNDRISRRDLRLIRADRTVKSNSCYDFTIVDDFGPCCDKIGR